MERYKALRDLEASLNILHANIQIFHSGNSHLYLVIAVELRKLLCDRTSTLLPRIFPGLHLHPHLGYVSKEQSDEWEKTYGASWDSLLDVITFISPGEMRFDGKGGSTVVRLFNETEQPIPLEEWLSQPLFSKKITVRELIKSVADKEAAHSDKDYNDTLKTVMLVKSANDDIHPKYVVAIGEYILKIIKPLYEAAVQEFNQTHGLKK